MECKKNVEIKDPVFGLNKRGSPVAHGKCGVCDTNVHRMLGRDDCPANLRANADKFKENKAKKGGVSNSRGDIPWPVPEMTINLPPFVKVDEIRHDPATNTITIRFG